MSQSIIYQFLKAGSQTITVPSGFSNQVLVYAWGAGGGSGTGAPGGGGGYAAGVVSISSGSTVIVSVGGAGGSTVGLTAAGSLAGLGNNPVIDLSGGVGAPGGDPEDNDAGGAGGGGGASAVFVNNIPMIVAAGAGGGGGLGEDWGGGDPENGKGRPGGVATEVNTVPRGADGRRGGAGGAGGGGAGYPFGGDSQRALYGDDVYSISQGGFGGQNYANATVTSSSLVAGSGTNTAGTTNGFYPGKSRGKAGYDGCVILVFQKLFTAWIKKSGYWKQVSSAYVKVPTTSYTSYSTPPGSARYSSSGTYTFVVPAGVTSLNASVTGGGGGGGGGGYGTGGEQSGSGGGGGSGYTTTGSISVTPGETLTVVVGAGGAAGSAQYSRSSGGFGGTGGTSTLSRGVSTLLTAAAGNGGTGGREAQTVAGGAGFNNGSVGVGASGTVRAGGNGGSSSLQSGGIGVASTSAPGANGSLGSGGAGGPASDSPDGANNGGAGGGGAVTISYISTPVATVSFTGGWKQIVRGWLKNNGVWENIATPVTLTPSKSETTPTRRAAINIVIATNASSYNLIEVLNGTGLYYPGYSDITLTINVGVIVDSEDGGTSALTVDGLTSGDSLIIVNNGTILGRGGAGGAAGYLSTTTVGSGKNSTTSTSVQAAGPGGTGGTALAVTYIATLENNGVIRGGGGGGGGGGISYNGTGGGQGGGGAGYGPGANAGTLTAGGAGAANGGAGGSSGANGVAGATGATVSVVSANGKGSTSVAGSAGGAGGVGGKAIAGYAKLTVTVTGTIVGATA